MSDQPIIKVGIVDDHVLLRIALSDLISGCINNKTGNRYDVTFQADNGRDMINKWNEEDAPEIILLDINMPEMDGYQAADWLIQHHPETKVIAITMDQTDYAVVQMLRRGVKGFLNKDVPLEELVDALDLLVSRGHYYSEAVVRKLVNAALQPPFPMSEVDSNAPLNDREVQFLKMIGTEWSYKEIADKMLLSPRTIDGYRDSLFLKLNVRSRIGLLMYAVKCGIIDVDLQSDIGQYYTTTNYMTNKN